MAKLNVETIVFLSLVLDLFAFTIPLPLFPRIIDWYTQRESSDPRGFLSFTLRTVAAFRSLFYNPGSNPAKWDVVLLGGFMGSVFSALQWFISPRIGSLSDKYGRKRVLLITMIGNILSALVWIQSTSFASYMLSRVIGGLSEGNVQLAIAILSDITTPETRAKALAHVGIAFAICFCIGPPIGAYFASQPVPTTFNASGFELNVYATPAIITLVLLSFETVFLFFALPETRGKRAQVTQPNGLANGNGVATNGHANGNGVTTNGHTNGNGVSNGHANGNGVTNGNGHVNGNGVEKNGHVNGNGAEKNGHANGNGVKANGHANGNGVHTNGNGVAKEANGKAVGRHETQGTVEERIHKLSVLRQLHFLFLGLFSGVEFTLTFLTFDLFDWNNRQNGNLIASIGIISALLQGGYVRRAMSKVGEGKMARRGVSSCALGLVFLMLVPLVMNKYYSLAVAFLRLACVCQAFTSATVVNALTSYASLQCDDGVDEDTGKAKEEHPELAKGKALGKFRSSGQLGRAIGPLLACASYWTFGPAATYAVSATAMFALSASMNAIARPKTH